MDDLSDPFILLDENDIVILQYSSSHRLGHLFSKCGRPKEAYSFNDEVKALGK